MTYDGIHYNRIHGPLQRHLFYLWERMYLDSVWYLVIYVRYQVGTSHLRDLLLLCPLCPFPTGLYWDVPFLTGLCWGDSLVVD